MLQHICISCVRVCISPFQPFPNTSRCFRTSGSSILSRKASSRRSGRLPSLPGILAGNKPEHDQDSSGFSRKVEPVTAVEKVLVEFDPGGVTILEVLVSAPVAYSVIHVNHLSVKNHLLYKANIHGRYL